MPQAPENSRPRKPRRDERGPGAAPADEAAGPAARLIREARQRRDYSQRQVAERSGFDQSLISRWERGRTDPSFGSVLRVLGACGYDLWAALEIVELHDAEGRIAELTILEEPTPPDVHGFRRIVRDRDAEVRQERAERRKRRGG